MKVNGLITTQNQMRIDRKSAFWESYSGCVWEIYCVLCISASVCVWNLLFRISFALLCSEMLLSNHVAESLCVSIAEVRLEKHFLLSVFAARLEQANLVQRNFILFTESRFQFNFQKRVMKKSV